MEHKAWNAEAGAPPDSCDVEDLVAMQVATLVLRNSTQVADVIAEVLALLPDDVPHPTLTYVRAALPRWRMGRPSC